MVKFTRSLYNRSRCHIDISMRVESLKKIGVTHCSRGLEVVPALLGSLFLSLR